MVEEYVGQFVERTLSSLGFETQTTVFKQDDRIYCNVETSNNSVVIGKNGVILRALNFITKSAVNTQFKQRIEISVKNRDTRRLLQWLNVLVRKYNILRSI